MRTNNISVNGITIDPTIKRSFIHKVFLSIILIFVVAPCQVILSLPPLVRAIVCLWIYAAIYVLCAEFIV
jgi:hypothetical protein